MVGDRLDLSSDPDDSPSPSKTAEKPDATGRRFVGIHFVCCDIYTRIYVNKDQTAYEGHCPKCCRKVRLSIGPGGTDCRFFTAY